MTVGDRDHDIDRGLGTSPLGRRLGVPLAVASLALTALVLLWLALAPTSVAGPLSAAPFTVPGTLVTDVDEAGCLRVVDGTGDAVTHCMDVVGDDVRPEAWFDADGRLLVRTDEFGGLVELDPTTGEVRDVDTGSDVQDPGTRVPPEPSEDPATDGYVVADGDRVVRRFESRFEREGDAAREDVLLDLDGPPGFEVRDAIASPDGVWVVAVTSRDDVVVAPVDGSAPPHVWAALSNDGWLDLRGAVRWDG